MEITSKDFSLLVSILDDIASIKKMDELFFNIFLKLQRMYKIKLVGFGIFDKEKKVLPIFIGAMDKKLNNFDSSVWLKNFLIQELPFQVNQTDFQILKVKPEFFENFEALHNNQKPIKEVHEAINCEYYNFLPMKTGGELVGYFIFASDEFQVNSDNLDYTFLIANLLGSAINNAISFNDLQQKETEKEVQINILTKLISIKNRDELNKRLAEEVSAFIPCEFLSIYTHHKGLNLKQAFSMLKDSNGKFLTQVIPFGVSEALVYSSAETITNTPYIYKEVNNSSLDELCKKATYFRKLKEKSSINSYLVIRYLFEELLEIYFILGKKEPSQGHSLKDRFEYMLAVSKGSYFLENEIELSKMLVPQISLVYGNFYSFETIQTLTKKLEQEKSYLLEEINLSTNFEEIIGASDSLNTTLNKVKQVAPLDATVLILGETGTGKELIARAIHNLSKRKENAFITINCAALPSQLIESELFGHERGSFTGAIEKKIGKFEVANGGTIFLDEIGELPLEIQSKLLRVLQEKEFERLGGKSTIYSDVRIVAATNRDLELEVKHGKFRADLFFRLNVFPIVSPPLRERTDDIPLLVKHFIEKYSKRIGKEVKSISKNDMDMLMQYNWPGNIRELEHIIERAMIISDGMNLSFERLLGASLHQPTAESQSFKPLLEIEKEHIIKALQLSLGKVTGENSAAQLLGLNGKTLGSRMRKLGIKREIVITS